MTKRKNVSQKVRRERKKRPWTKHTGIKWKWLLKWARREAKYYENRDKRKIIIK